MAEELWLPVVGFEGFYEVSSLGRVKSLPRITVQSNGRERWFPGVSMRLKNNRGYLQVVLKLPGGPKQTLYVHRMVALAFLGEPPYGFECDHIDQNRSNCVLSNLRWVSKPFNLQHKTSAKLTKEDVVVIREQHAAGIDKAELALIYNVDKTHIHQVVMGKLWKELACE